MEPMAAFLTRDHSPGLDHAGRVGFEVWRAMGNAGIEIKLTVSGPLAALGDERKLMASHRAEILMVWVAAELLTQARAWAKRCRERGLKNYNHDEERLYYGLKGRASCALPRGVSLSELGIGSVSWDPTLSSAFVPDSAYAFDIPGWERPCPRPCPNCAAMNGQRSFLASA